MSTSGRQCRTSSGSLGCWAAGCSRMGRVGQGGQESLDDQDTVGLQKNFSPNDLPARSRVSRVFSNDLLVPTRVSRVFQMVYWLASAPHPINHPISFFHHFLLSCGVQPPMLPSTLTSHPPARHVTGPPPPPPPPRTAGQRPVKEALHACAPAPAHAPAARVRAPARPPAPFPAVSEWFTGRVNYFQ